MLGRSGGEDSGDGFPPQPEQPNLSGLALRLGALFPKSLLHFRAEVAPEIEKKQPQESAIEPFGESLFGSVHGCHLPLKPASAVLENASRAPSGSPVPSALLLSRQP